MKTTTLLLFILFVIQVKGSAQHMTIQKGSKISYQGEFYGFYESEQIFKQSNVPHVLYLKSIKPKNASKAWGALTLVGFLGGFIIWNPNIIRTKYALIPVFTGLVSIINHSTFKTRFQEAVYAFNSNNDIGYMSKKNINLSFGLSQNGVGLVLNF